MISCVHRTKLLCAVFCPFFHHLPSVTVKHHCELQVAYTRKMNTFSNETCLNGTYQSFIFLSSKFISTHPHTLVTPYERFDCCDHCISHRNNTSARYFSSTTLSRLRANFLHQTCIAGLAKHLSPHTGCMSEWMAFGQSNFVHRKRITERCSSRDSFTGNVAIFIVYKWCHSKDIIIKVIVIKLTAITQN